MKKSTVIFLLAMSVLIIGAFNIYGINTYVNERLQDEFGITGVLNGPDAEETGYYGPPTPTEYQESGDAWAWHDFLAAVAAWWWLILAGILLIIWMVMR